MTDTPPPDIFDEPALTPDGMDVILPAQLSTVITNLIPLGDVIRETIASVRLLPIAEMEPAERSEVVLLRRELDRLRRDIGTWVDAIDISFRHAAEAEGAREVLLERGVVTIEPPRGSYVIPDPVALRKALAKLASEPELEAIFTEVRETKVNNTKLNALERRRGDEARRIIGQHRHYVVPDGTRAKIDYPTGGDR